MMSPTLHRRWLRRGAAAIVSMSAVIGMGTPAPADTVYVCVESAACDTPGLSVPFDFIEAACGPGSAGELARQTVYGTGEKPIYVCDKDRAYEVGVYPAYVVVGTEFAWVAVFPD